MRAVVRRMQELGLSRFGAVALLLRLLSEVWLGLRMLGSHLPLDPTKIGPLPEPDGVKPLQAGDRPRWSIFFRLCTYLAFCTDRSQRRWQELLRNQGRCAIR